MKKILLFVLTFYGICFSQQDFWEQTNGPYGGNIWAQAINSKGYIFEGVRGIESALGIGIIRSTNNGENWELINNGLDDNKSKRIYSIIINLNDCILAETEGGLYRSTDDGENWIKLNSPTNLKPLNSNSFGYFFGMSSQRIYRSTDNGETWIEADNGLPINSPNNYIESLAVNSKDDIYVGIDYVGIYMSTDNGDNWTNINNGLANYDSSSFRIDEIVVNSDDEIFVGAGFNYFSGIVTHTLRKPTYSIIPVIFKSTNNGESWTASNVSYNQDYIYSMAFNSSNMIFLSTKNGTYRSTDGGNSWDALQIGGETSNIVINSYNEILAGTYIGVFRSTDNGNNWNQIGVYNSEVSTISINSNDDIFASAPGGIYRTSDDGGVWTRINDSLNVSVITHNSLGDIFVGTTLSYDQIGSSDANNSSKNGIFRSTNNGESWTEVYSYFNDNDQVYSTGAIAIDSNDNIYVGINGYNRNFDLTNEYFPEYYTYGVVYKSTDNGINWDSTNYMSYGEWDQGLISSLAINSDGNIFMGTQFAIFRSSDEGKNWTKIIHGITNSISKVNSIVFNSSGDIYAGILYGGSAGYVYKSTDTGDNWNITGFTNGGVFNLDVNSKDYIFAITFKGLYNSTDGGNTWINIDESVLTGYNSVYYVSAVAINSKDRIFVGTHASGVFRSIDTFAVPVELLTLSGSIVNKKVKLRWCTATETNNKGFEIQRKASGINEKDLEWNSIGFVNGNGTTTEKKAYSFIDKSVSSGKYTI